MNNLKILTSLAAKSPINFKTTATPTVVNEGDLIYLNGRVWVGKPISGRTVLSPVGQNSPSYIHNQGITSSTWTINHNLNTIGTPSIQIVDSNNNPITPIS